MSDMTRELYNTMADGDADVQLDVLRDLVAKKEAADSNKSIDVDTKNNSGQQKETDVKQPVI